MLEGMIDFLLSTSELAQNLLSNYVFKIVPMVNIDGVVHGNSRAELIGCDSNRRWSDPHKFYDPIVSAIKKMI
jgi:murein tripeptide amidase MpaA